MRINFIAKSGLFKNLIGGRYITSKVSMDIQTFAFLDTETTGLPYQEYNKTKLTELCLTVVQSEHICLGVYPRVQNKLTFCFNPWKMVTPGAEEITGLSFETCHKAVKKDLHLHPYKILMVPELLPPDYEKRLSNILLENQPSFTKETVELMLKFLQTQRKPICLVAHNGNAFDYPILQAEIHNTGGTFPDDILCMDTLIMFRQLHNKRESGKEVEQKENAKNPSVVSSSSSVPKELCDGYDEIICRSIDEYEKTQQKLNETTPLKGSQPSVAQTQFNVTDIDDLYFNPNRHLSTSVVTLSVTPPSPARKQLDYGKPSFKLGDVYQRLTQKSPEKAHRAEDDCHMLIECAAVLGQEFVDWANKNATKFCDIPMMQPGRKIGS